MIKILVLSDEHLRESIRTAGVTLEGDCRFAINQIKTLCDTIKPNIVIHAGDIFNQRNVSPEELNLFRELLKAAGVPENSHYTIQGNHDRGGDRPIPQSLGCSNLNNTITPVNVEDVALTLWGRDYDQEIVEDKITGEHGALVHVLHFPCRPFNNRVESALTVDEMFPKSLVIIGDTHVAKLVSTKSLSLVLSPGALFPQNKTELCNSKNSTGVWLIMVKSSHKISKKDIIQLPLISRRGLDLTSVNDVEEVTNRIRAFLTEVSEEPKKLGLEVTPLTPVVYINANMPDVNVEGDFILIRVSEGTELNPVSESLESVSTSIDAIPKLVEKLVEDKEEAEEVSSMILDMWKTNSPQEVINEWIKKKEVPLNEADGK